MSQANKKKTKSPASNKNGESSNEIKVKQLTLVKDTQSYFRDLVSEVCDKRRIKTEPHTEYYLVNLLTHFMHADNLFESDPNNGGQRQEALAIILKASLEAADFVNRQKNLKKLGDVSLYTAGFFGESLARKIVDMGYYIDMGKSAYSNLSTLIPDEDFSKLFAELSERFDKFVDVLAEISDRTKLAPGRTPQDLIQMYELWLKTKSERAEESLKKAGIIPTKIDTKKKPQ